MPHSGGMNAGSRYAMSLAVGLDGNLTIDDYHSTYTADWSQTPDGHYYSNKAPLPALLGAPIVWFISKTLVSQSMSREQRHQYFFDHTTPIRTVISWLTQVIPMAILAYFLAAALTKWGFSDSAISIATIAILFGSTASVYFNNFFGHGLAAICALAATMFAIERKIVWSAFFFGAALLSDYGSAFLLPGLALFWFWNFPDKNEGQNRKNVLRTIGQIAMGAIIPAAIWIGYHTKCFGSPFTLPNKFQNPAWLDLKGNDDALWGIFHSYPQPKILFELVFGVSRGLLFTQPWILLIFGFGVVHFFRPRNRRLQGLWWFYPLNLLFVSSLFLLLIMNASFGGWHGGATNGPRYLTPIMLVGGLLAGAIWDHSHRFVQKLLLGTVGFGVFYFCVGFAQDLQTDMNPWLEYFHGMAKPVHTVRVVVSIGIMIALTKSLVLSTRQPANQS